MKISFKTLLVVAILTLLGGLLLGWFIFGQSSESEHRHTELNEGETEWTCSMHPQIRQKEPGTCPICGMDLIPLEGSNGEEIDPMAVAMSPTALQLANIATAIVGSESVVKNLQLNGKVQEDERLIFSQTTHFPGRIEKLSVNFTGEYVSKGSVIAYLYSPELITAQEELFEASKIRESQPNLYRAAREKLKNWKLSDNQIDQILSSGNVKDQFPVRADQSGYVIDKKVNLGDYVKKGQSLYQITNLARVWVLFDVYEKDLAWVSKGDSIQFEINSLPGKTYKGKIDYIDPVIDPNTRVSKARVDVQNQDQKLKPEMFVTGQLNARLDKTESKLTVPRSAVMWTGKRSVVYIKLKTDQGLYFKLREVTLGPMLGDSYVIEKGLEAGEEIAVNGAFSIDAAAQLAGKPSMMSPEGGAVMTGHNHGDMKTNSSATDHNQHQTNVKIEVNESDQVFESDPEFKNQIKAVFAAYLPLKDALVQSDIKNALIKAENLREAIGKVDMKLVKAEAHHEWMKDMAALMEITDSILGERNIEQARIMFSPLSDQLFYTLKKFKVNVKAFRQYCPMAFDFKGAFWLSNSEEILNPYFGDEMLTCGNVEEEL